MTRGRKSAAALSVVTPIGAARPAPPDGLTAAQAEVWRSVVDRLPADWFPRETFDLLASYCRHVTTARYLTRMVEACEAAGITGDDGLKDYDRVLAMRDREDKAMIAAARSLRITPASRLRPETAYRRAAVNPGGAPRPWDLDHNHTARAR
jgi:hypothetical protein